MERREKDFPTFPFAYRSGLETLCAPARRRPRVKDSMLLLPDAENPDMHEFRFATMCRGWGFALPLRAGQVSCCSVLLALFAGVLVESRPSLLQRPWWQGLGPPQWLTRCRRRSRSQYCRFANAFRRSSGAWRSRFEFLAWSGGNSSKLSLSRRWPV